MTFAKIKKEYMDLRQKALSEIKSNLKGKSVRFNDLTLRDGHQSLFATRMTGEQIARIVTDIARSGFYDMEVWGGATLDVCMRYLDENPFERLGMITAACKGHCLTRALCRGANLFGYQPYPADIIRDFSVAALDRGLDIMRIFDALNDPENLKVAVKSVKDAGGKVDAAISYTTGPIFTVDYWTDICKTYEKLGADMISVKDMAGLATPEMAWELIPALGRALTVPVHWHSHCTPGFGHITAVIAMMLGIDCVDTCFMPFAGGSSHPSVELLHFFATRLGIDDGLDTTNFVKIDSELRTIREELVQFDSFKGFIPEPFCVTEKLEQFADDVIVAIALGDLNLATVLMHKIEDDMGFPPADAAVRDAQVPGGMLTNMLSQLEAFGMLDRLTDVLEEIPVVREACGSVPLVTPTSQIVGVQAVNNVKFGRWQNNIIDYVRLVKGEFGKTPVPIDPDFREKITGQRDEIRYDASDFDYTLPVWGDLTSEELYPDRESELCYYLFPKVAGGEKGFLARRATERREKTAEAEHLDYVTHLMERAQFKLSSKNPRVSILSPDEAASLHDLLMASVQGGAEYPEE
jgi:pyruvate carboxylase subunit B